MCYFYFKQLQLQIVATVATVQHNSSTIDHLHYILLSATDQTSDLLNIYTHTVIIKYPLNETGSCFESKIQQTGLFFPQWVFISLSNGGYGSNVLLQYVITANKAHNTENMATIAFNVHIKIELMALCPKTISVFIDFFLTL